MKEPDPDIVAETIQTELNSIIALLSPQRHIVNANDDQPYIKGELKAKLTEVNSLSTIALHSKDKSNWRAHKNARKVLY